MTFTELIQTRYSVRDFSEAPVEEEKLQKILAAGMLAPTGHNYQPQRVYVLKSSEAIAKIRGLTRCAFNAPYVLMFTYDTNEDWKNPFEEGIHAGQQDVSIVATHMMLAAWDLGIGTCWVNYFPNSLVKQAFGLPQSEEVVLLLPMGYPSQTSHPAKLHDLSRPMAQIVKEL